jgi:hypothetical protein
MNYFKINLSSQKVLHLKILSVCLIFKEAHIWARMGVILFVLYGMFFPPYLSLLNIYHPRKQFPREKLSACTEDEGIYRGCCWGWCDMR